MLVVLLAGEERTHDGSCWNGFAWDSVSIHDRTMRIGEVTFHGVRELPQMSRERIQRMETDEDGQYRARSEAAS